MGRHLQPAESLLKVFPVKIRICLLEFLLFHAEASGGPNEVELQSFLSLQVAQE